MKVFGIISFFLIFTTSIHAQKVKIKKDIAIVDDIEFLDLTECNSLSCTFKTLNGKEVLSVQWESFEKPNPVKRNPKSKAPYQSTVNETYAIINFFDFDLEFETELTARKAIIKEVFNNNIIDSEGNISEENAKRFAKKYGKDISGTRPIQIIRN